MEWLARFDSIDIVFVSALLLFFVVLGLLKTFSVRKDRFDATKTILLRSGIGHMRLHTPSPFEHRRREDCRLCEIGFLLGPKKGKELLANQRLLATAGFRKSHHLGMYYFLKYMAVLSAVLVCLLLWGWDLVQPIVALVIPIFVLLLPERLLKMQADKRLEKVNQALPDFLDMANICMNAGLSYIDSIHRVSRELENDHPELAGEFKSLIEQIKVGVPRVEALQALAERNPTKDIEEMSQMLIQNEKMGAPISKALHEFTRRIYSRRQNLMEEKAAKTSAKMALVILPFLLIPYFIIMLAEQFVMMMRNF
ncbi:MAG: type II secretion system F family protein [Hydrogenovibrio sp.]|uniref:type II secretion system F family protein n=1 Tax=Hydrogenovibrio sp. TaxID=2065821 RepID=UPI0028704470|nr:type II secretion system F family protein [Hydrogenovibrio sp.]MDR9497579.1 type II secretion system F family protein [Hydrogenovibrio sp.]